MEWRVGLEAYEGMAIHGYYDEEHLTAQRFILSIWADLSEAGRVDALEDTLNYADIQVAVDEVMLNSPKPIRLMEEMAQRIIDRLAAHRGVASITVRIEKPQAPLPHPGGLPAIEARWQRV